MLSSIHPLGERSRGQRFWLTATSYVAGSAIGGAALGTLLGLGGTWLAPHGSARLAALAVMAGAGLIHDLRPAGLHLATPRRQVDENWLVKYRGWVYGLGYGLQLGVGVATIITTGLVYLTWAAAFLSGSVAAGLAIGATFGIVRGAALFVVAGVRTPEQLHAAHRGLDRLRPGAGRVSTVVLAAGLVTSAVAAVG